MDDERRLSKSPAGPSVFQQIILEAERAERELRARSATQRRTAVARIFADGLPTVPTQSQKRRARAIETITNHPGFRRALAKIPPSEQKLFEAEQSSSSVEALAHTLGWTVQKTKIRTNTLHYLLRKELRITR